MYSPDSAGWKLNHTDVPQPGPAARFGHPLDAEKLVGSGSPASTVASRLLLETSSPTVLACGGGKRVIRRCDSLRDPGAHQQQSPR